MAKTELRHGRSRLRRGLVAANDDSTYRSLINITLSAGFFHGGLAACADRLRGEIVRLFGGLTMQATFACHANVVLATSASVDGPRGNRWHAAAGRGRLDFGFRTVERFEVEER